MRVLSLVVALLLTVNPVFAVEPIPNKPESKFHMAWRGIKFASRHPLLAVYATGKWADDNHVNGALWLLGNGATIARLFY